MDLGGCRAGDTARVVSIDLEPGARLRLQEMGLRVGSVLRVSQRAAFGGLVVAVGADRFALDARTCGRIAVEEPAR